MFSSTARDHIGTVHKVTEGGLSLTNLQNQSEYLGKAADVYEQKQIYNWKEKADHSQLMSVDCVSAHSIFMLQWTAVCWHAQYCLQACLNVNKILQKVFLSQEWRLNIFYILEMDYKR